MGLQVKFTILLFCVILRWFIQLATALVLMFLVLTEIVIAGWVEVEVEVGVVILPTVRLSLCTFSLLMGIYVA
jgi:hypothetical protein